MNYGRNDLAGSVCHNVDKSVERLVVEGLLCKFLTNLLCATSDLGHVELEIQLVVVT